MKFDRVLTISSTSSLADTYPVLQHLQPMAYFDFLFDEEMFRLLAEQTLLYARVDKNDLNCWRHRIRTAHFQPHETGEFECF